MRNADQPAMPIFDSNGAVWCDATQNDKGLTKREMMAMHIMSGLAGDSDASFEGIKEARCAVRWADALLAELEATK